MVKKHGLKGTAIYLIWKSIVSRCENPNRRAFPRYGGRGIKVCERWRTDAAAFAADMGPRPSPQHTVDRWPDKDGDYEPGNCRWATPTEQARHTRRNVLLTFNGETLCAAEWAERVGVNQKLIQKRIKKGWPAERVLAVPERRAA